MIGPSGYLYPVTPDPVVGDNGEPIVGNPSPGRPLTALEASALVQKEIG